MTRRSARALLAAALLGTGALSLLAAAEAGAGGRWQPGPEGDVAVAVSRFGNGSVSGPVRPSRTGYEVRLPGGTWVGCRRSCSETLRVETVDLFENQGSMTGYGTAMNECGIFGCLELRYPR